MSKLKDKLSANMRAVKASQEPAAAEPSKAASDKPAAEKPVAKPAKSAPASGAAVPGDVPQSGTALFPARVWPD